MATAIPVGNGSQPLFARIMGPGFALLPPAVRRLHSGNGLTVAVGRADVVRGPSALAGAIAMLFGFPPTGAHVVRVTFAASPAGERWTRDFGGHRFSSHLTEAGGRVVERFGPYRFSFELVNEDGGLSMRMTNWSFVGLPMPMRLAPRAVAREWQQDGAFHFHVELALPLVGDVVRYSGWLEPDQPLPL